MTIYSELVKCLLIFVKCGSCVEVYTRVARLEKKDKAKLRIF